MGDLNEKLKKLSISVQERCAERIKTAQSMAIGKISYDKPLQEEYGISSILKKKHGL